MRILAAVFLLVACTDNTEPRADVGGVVVRVSTFGADLDPDGYGVTVDDRTTLKMLPPDSLVLFGSLEPGTHVVQLDGVDANCDPDPLSGTFEVEVRAGTTTTVRYIVACYATGLMIQSTVEGLDPGTHYTVVLDGQRRSEVLPVNQSLDLTALSAGTHEVRLDDIPANCVVTPDRHVVEVALRTVRAVEFVARCNTAYGLLEVRVASTGQDLDLGGFDVEVDGDGYFGAPTNGVGSHLVVPGSHQVRLQQVARNCEVSGGEARSAILTAGGFVRDTTRVTYEVSCRKYWELAFARYGKVVLATSDGLVVDVALEGTRPAWSPDGTQLAWDCRGVCIASMETGSVVYVTSNLRLSAPAWSPDGSRVVYVGTECTYYYYYDYYESCQFNGLFRARPDGSQAQRIPLPANVLGATDPAWSPDGITIAFSCAFHPEETQNLCTVRTDGSDFRRLHQTGGHDGQPGWSPDGSRLVLTTTRFGSREIVTVLPDGTDLHRFEPPVIGSSPSWARDGRILYASGLGIRSMNADGSDRKTVTQAAGDSLPTLRPQP